MSSLVRYPLACMVLLVLLLLLTGSFFPHLESRYEVEDFFPKNTLVRQNFDDYRMRFGRDDRWAFVLIESQQVWSGNDFQRLKEVQKRLEKLQQIDRKLKKKRHQKSTSIFIPKKPRKTLVFN